MILIVMSDLALAKIIRKNCQKITSELICIDNDPFSAIEFIDFAKPPKLIFLQALLIGTNAFSFLDELRSHAELLSVPVILLNDLMSLKHLTPVELADYNLSAILNLDQITPDEIRKIVRETCRNSRKKHQKTA